jgi:hypothetical protein
MWGVVCDMAAVGGSGWVAVSSSVGKSEFKRFEWCKLEFDWLGIDRVAVESAIVACGSGWVAVSSSVGKSEFRRSEWCKIEFDWLGIEGVPIQNVGSRVFFCGGRVAVVGWQ